LFSHALGLAVLLAAAPVGANGAFPAAGQLIVDPSDPQHLVLRTTFGMVVSHDAGATWGWVCESSALYMNEEPAIAVAGNGAIVAAVSDGLSLATPDACDWTLASGIDPKVRDVSVQRDDPSRVVAVTSDAVADVTRLWESSSHGATWSQAGVSLPAGFFATTLDVAPSNPMRVYVAGLDGMGQPALCRTDDRGQTWVQTPIVQSAMTAIPYLGAVHPTNADVVYVRVDADPGRVVVSADAGASWSEPFIGTGPMRGFALSPDGETLLVGDILGVWRAPASTLAFTQVSDVFVQCLTWSAAGVYACSNEFVEGFFVGTSSDRGTSFSPLLHMFCIPGPLACAAGTTVGDACAAEWPAIAAQINAEDCSRGGGGAGGAGGAGGGATGSGAGGPGPGTSAGGSGGAPGSAPPPGSPDCTCAARGAGAPDAALAAALGGLVLVIRRARRRPARPR
jgi:hypothetical protein